MARTSTPLVIHTSDSAVQNRKITTFIQEKHMVNSKRRHLLCRLALQRIFSSSPQPSHLETAFVKRVQNRTRTYADINCAGEKRTNSQTKRHERKERLSSNKCVAAHSTTVANSTLWQPNSEVSQRSVCKYMTRHQIILFHYNKNAAGYALAY